MAITVAASTLAGWPPGAGEGDSAAHPPPRQLVPGDRLRRYRPAHRAAEVPAGLDDRPGRGRAHPHAVPRAGRRGAQRQDERDARRGAGRLAADARGRGVDARGLPRLHPTDDPPRPRGRADRQGVAAAAGGVLRRPAPLPGPLPRRSARRRPPDGCGARVPHGPPPPPARSAGREAARLRGGGLHGRRVPAAPLRGDVGVVDPAGALDSQCCAGRCGAVGVDPVQPGRHRQEAEAAGPAARSAVSCRGRADPRGRVGAGRGVGRPRVAGHGDRDAAGRGARAALVGRRP